MTKAPPIIVAPLFREISQRLVELLRNLAAHEWQLPTLSSQRRVKDIAAHLLDGSLRRLSMQRDGYTPPMDSDGPRKDETLLDFLTRLNAEWEIGVRRLSPCVLIDLIAWADEQVAGLFESLDPFAPAIFPVTWAGEATSQNWMDVAREYTEKWHHTQQIFDATGRTSTITDRRLFHPCLDAFMRALPFAYRQVDGDEGSEVSVVILGDAGGEWLLVRRGGLWELTAKPRTDAGGRSARVIIRQDSAWKIFTKRSSRDLVLRSFPDVRIEGDRDLGGPVLDMVSVMS